MLDCSIDEEYRGYGCALHLLRFLENEVNEKGTQALFTTARATSEEINITFSKTGYTYGRRLKNNTDISGTIESMNVWYMAL